MRKRNGHPSSKPFWGIPKPIPTQTWRARLADSLSAYAEPIVLTVGFIIVMLDVFIWRP